MKMFSATMPTNSAASHSMVLIIRSMTLVARFVMAAPAGAFTSERGVVLLEAGLQTIHHHRWILGALLPAVAPLGVDRRDRLAPGVELLGRQLVDLVPRFGGDLGATGIFEVGP